MLKNLLALILATTLVLSLAAFAACGGDDDDTDAGDDGPAAEETEGGDDGGDDSGDDDGDDDGDGGSDLESYFASMEEIGVETDDALEAIGVSFEQEFESDEAYVQAVKDAFLEAGQILESAAVRVGDLDPPSEVEDAHEAFLVELGEMLATSSDFYEESLDLETGEEIDALGEQYGPQFTDDQDTFDEACLALQDIAAENGITVDLRCG